MANWRSVAARTIWAAVEKAKADGVTEPKEILRRVSDAYPFGPREHHPYKIWLDEVRLLKRRLGVAVAPKRTPTPGEGDLFGGRP